MIIYSSGGEWSYPVVIPMLPAWDPNAQFGSALRQLLDPVNVVLSSGLVSQWTDTSGLGRNVDQPNAELRPAWSPSDGDFAGHPSIKFTLSKFLDSVTWPPETQPLTVIAVMCSDTGSNSTGWVYSNATNDNLTVASGDGYYMGNGGTLKTHFCELLCGWDGSRDQQPRANQNTRTIFAEFNGTSQSKFYGDGELSAAGNGGNGTSASTRIGARYTGDAGLVGRIGYLMVVGRILTDHERAEVAEQLNSMFVPGNLVCIGDSLTYGYAATSGQAAYPGALKAKGILSRAARVWNFGVSGANVTTLAGGFSLVTHAAAIADGMINSHAPFNICELWGGINDLTEDIAASDIYSALMTIAADRAAKGWLVELKTVLPANPVFLTPPRETQRQLLNSMIRGNGIHSVTDVAADPRLQNPSNFSYFYGDRVHLIDAGYAVVAELSAVTLNQFIP